MLRLFMRSDGDHVSDRSDTLAVGGGFAGVVLAERLASQCGRRVLVVDRRPHIAGNAHDALDAHAVLVHTYGRHIFHMNAPRVVNYLSCSFTSWRPYENHVVAHVDGRRYKALAAAQPGATFVGQLARYQYLNMDQVTAQALATFDHLVETVRLGALTRT